MTFLITHTLDELSHIINKVTYITGKYIFYNMKPVKTCIRFKDCKLWEISSSHCSIAEHQVLWDMVLCHWASAA